MNVTTHLTFYSVVFLWNIFECYSQFEQKQQQMPCGNDSPPRRFPSLFRSDLFRIMSKYFVIYFWLSVFALSEQTHDITKLFIGVNMLGCNCSAQTRYPNILDDMCHFNFQMFVYGTRFSSNNIWWASALLKKNIVAVVW